MALLANARMYSISPDARNAWRTLLEWVLERAGIAAEFVNHEPPLLLADLWGRDDLACVMMCGLPVSLRTPAPTLLAAPVPCLPRYAGRSVYMTDIAVRSDSPYANVEDTFGGIAGYTLKDSQSGYFAFRHHLITRCGGTRPRYRAIVGNLMNARGIIQALDDGRIDVGPLDGYVHDLLRNTDPEFAAKVRVVGVTEPTPMPPLVATAALDADTVSRARAAFLAVSGERSLAEARSTLLLERFIVPELATFQALRERQQVVDSDAEDWS